MGQRRIVKLLLGPGVRVSVRLYVRRVVQLVQRLLVVMKLLVVVVKLLRMARERSASDGVVYLCATKLKHRTIAVLGQLIRLERWKVV